MAEAHMASGGSLPPQTTLPRFKIKLHFTERN